MAGGEFLNEQGGGGGFKGKTQSLTKDVGAACTGSDEVYGRAVDECTELQEVVC